MPRTHSRWTTRDNARSLGGPQSLLRRVRRDPVPTRARRGLMDPIYIYNAVCYRIVDGDTYYLNIDLGFQVAITIDVRLRGVDTPELDTVEGKAARYFVTDLLAPSILGVTPTPLVVQ